MDGGWTESGKPRPIPNEDTQSAAAYRWVASLERGWLCVRCGAFVGDTEVHDHFHAA